MAWKPKKKPKQLSYAEQQFVKKLIEDAKAKRKTMRGYAVLKRKGSEQDLKINGMWRDINELTECANSFAQKLCETSGKKWEVLEVIELKNTVYEDDENEYNINHGQQY